MKPADVCLAILVAVIWGLAFVAGRIALDEFSPALMTTLRFAVAALPCLLVPRPKVAWPVLISISLTLFLGQFLAQAYGIAHGVPVGLSSVIVQSQALFTISFAAIAFRELPTRWQAAGMGVATLGLLMICGTVGYDFSAGAFAVLMICPISFAIGNLLLRRAQNVRMFDLFAWLCLTAAIPLSALTLLTDGPQATWHSLSNMTLTGLLCMLGLGGVSTSIAYWRAAGAVRRRRRLECRFRRAVRPAAAFRHGRCGVRHRGDAAVEAAARRAEIGLSTPCRSRFSSLLSCSPR